MTPTAHTLVARVLDVVPARSHALGALLQLFRVEVTEDVPTACVSCERRPVLRINPRFVEEHCTSDAHLFMLVMHELHHVLLGHTRLFPRVTPAHNVAFDAVINALLCLRFPQEAYTSFFAERYGDEEDALRLLGPPGTNPPKTRALAALHDALYAGEATAEEVFKAIVREVGEEQIPLEALLGSHGATVDGKGDGSADGDGEAGGEWWGTEGPADPAVVDAIRRIVEKWPPPERPVKGRSLCDVLKDETVSARSRVPPAVLQATRRALLGAAVNGRRASRRQLGPTPALLPIPDPGDRRAGVARSVGASPLLYASTLLDRRGRGDGATHVYLDVSFSMNEWIEDVYGALTALRRHLHPEVHLFSTIVRSIPLAKLVEGVRFTTGGTSIACVLEHALERKARRVLVVTDGYVGQPAESEVDRLRRAGLELRVLLTPDGWRPDLEGCAARLEQLPQIGRERTP